MERSGSTCRILCRIDHEDAWLESDDTELYPGIEAFAGAMMTPALAVGAQLKLHAPVDTHWLSRQRKLAEWHRLWWYPDQPFPIEQAPQTTGKNLQARSVATCFTCGVDSFDTLLQNLNRIDVLLFVQGFDIPLDDTPRMDAMRSSLHTVARALGKRSLILRTNLRNHHLFGQADWRHTHGAALAAAGHAASPAIGRLLIPSSYYLKMDYPWGSHWKTDPLHSSSRIVFEHNGHSAYRLKKINRISHHPLVQKHLRVCWENRADTGNCGECEKCIRTMAALHAVGALESSLTFPRHPSLVERMLVMPTIPRKSLIRNWSSIYAFTSQPELRTAILHLIERSFPGAPLDLPPFRHEPEMHLRLHWNNWKNRSKRPQ
ncbi:MAG TPA: hypothetical protein PKE55_11055 [Kiritimatiellia bacterium]|nr:hypothetical protein [Kiritimatiellia bacterium]